MEFTADVVYHFSEDPTITRFSPHLAKTAQVKGAYVWAVPAHRACDYWFPRQCPRAMTWARPDSDPAEVQRILGPDSSRVHAIEYGWLEAIRTVELYVYRFDPAGFRPIDDTDEPPAVVHEDEVIPLGPAEPVGDLFALHERAGIQLRVLPRLHEFWAAVITSTLGFSGIRLRNALP
ncbi:DUF6886 family protein [Microlunatus speluncae]|uniref:DUF6886 family protein n=1 Tax=Microlunatus speluncae TaxID=2594267 RepID=UPI0012661460|nr:DUF6886 family protein [Microlunatus speluncae]